MPHRIFYLLSLLALTSVTCMNFCELTSPELNLPTSNQQIQQISLTNYIKGYNLTFSTNNSDIIEIVQPYNEINSTEIKNLIGYQLVNTDLVNSNTNLWLGQAILFATKDTKHFAIAYPDFKYGDMTITNPLFEGQLPYNSTCYSARIYNPNLDIILDCQLPSTQNSNSSQDILYTIAGPTRQINYTIYQSITKSPNKKTLIYNIGQYSFLMSAALSHEMVDPKFENQTFVNIYLIRQRSTEFNMVVDRNVLKLESLAIVDMDLVELEGKNYVVLTDSVNSKLILFRYTQFNTIQDIIVLPVTGILRSFVVSSAYTWLIATNRHILQYIFIKSTHKLILKHEYQLDPSANNKVIDIYSANNFFIVRTSDNIYTYAYELTAFKYILNNIKINNQILLITSPFYPKLFQITNTNISTVSLTGGYLYINPINITDDTTVHIQANSYLTTCNMILIIKIENNTIYRKKNISDKYRVQGNTPIKLFNLPQYFGGSNLDYTINTSSKQILWNLQYVNIYLQNNVTKQYPPLFTKIVQLDPTTYYLASFTFNKTSNQTNFYTYFYKCILNQTNNRINCTQSSNITLQNIISNVHALHRQNDILFTWTYKSGNKFANRIDIKKIDDEKPAFVYVRFQPRFTQILVTQQYNIYLEKQLSRITFISTNTVYTAETFTKNDFTDAQLSILKGFYPRQVMASPSNPTIFYLKFPIAIVKISYTGGRQLSIISLHKISDKYIHDDDWSIVVGKKTLLLYIDNQFKQITLRADSKIQTLHTIPFNNTPILPLRYQISTDTAYFQCHNDSNQYIQYIRLNQPKLQSKYHSIKTSQKNNLIYWDVSGSWLLTSTNNVYYQFKQPSIIIQSHSNINKQTFTFNLTVSNDQSSITDEETTNVTVFNYPMQIVLTSQKNEIIQLPQKANSQIILFPIIKYFNGSVSSHKILCQMCVDRIKLLTPIKQLKQNKNLNKFQTLAAVQSIGVIVLKDNVLTLVDFDNQQITKQQIQNITGKCQSMGINTTYLIIYCRGPQIQQLLLYQINKTSIDYLNRFPIPVEANLISPSSIEFQINTTNHWLIFIHDVNLINPIAKDSNIKIFTLNQTLNYFYCIDSNKFQISTFQPINSMSIFGNHMLVSLGGKGLGYINILDAQYGQFISLQSQSSLQDYTLDDTIYLKVKILSDTNSTIKALITTSNSLNYVLSFNLSSNGIHFHQIEQMYNRFAHQLCHNWGLIDQNYLILGYYNETTSVESLTLYKRQKRSFINFTTSQQNKISQLSLPKGVFIRNQTNLYLFMNNRNQFSEQSDVNSLIQYNITDYHSLLLKYDQPETFTTIKVTALNQHSQISIKIPINFAGSKHDNQTSWQVILIIVISVVIGIGIIAGIYIKCKRKKQQSKKVSLYSEKEQLEQNA